MNYPQETTARREFYITRLDKVKRFNYRPILNTADFYNPDAVNKYIPHLLRLKKND